MKTGYLAFVSNPNKPIQEFTQEQIDNDQVLFVQKGKCTPPPTRNSQSNINDPHIPGGQSGKFQFQFSDGESTSEQMTFHISAKIVEIRMIYNRKLQIFPMLKKQISPELLLSVTSDFTTSRGKSIVYGVKTPPEHGKLLLQDENGGYSEVDKFTQAEVNGSKVWYQHSDRFKNMLVNDRFVFDVNADFTKPLPNQVSIVLASLLGLV